MGQYIFAPAGPSRLRSRRLKNCIEFIGSTQGGYGSNLAKGKRYLKSKIPACSGTAIKRAMKTMVKVHNHDFQKYGVDVFYYHKEVCSDILFEVIKFIISYGNDDVKTRLLGTIPQLEEYVDLIYRYRISQLKWVCDENYKGQHDEASKLCAKFDRLHF